MLEIDNLVKIGESNSSKIYQLEGESSRVMKTIKHSQNNHLKQCVHLKNEYQILRKLQHPNIIRVESYNVYQLKNSDKSICSMEMERGQQDLLQLLEQKFPKLLDFKTIIEIMRSITEALDYLHSMEITHNDLKIENVIMFDGGIPKLADFGFANRTKEHPTPNELYKQKTDWAARCRYCLPPEIEKFLNSSNYKYLNEYKSDIFSLGVIFFSIIFLRPPCQDSTDHSDQDFSYVHSNNSQKYWSLKDFTNIFESFSSQISPTQKSHLQDLLWSMI